MGDDFNPETLLNDIDKIMVEQGYASYSSAATPVEVEAAAEAAIPPAPPAMESPVINPTAVNPTQVNPTEIKPPVINPTPVSTPEINPTVTEPTVPIPDIPDAPVPKSMPEPEPVKPTPLRPISEIVKEANAQQQQPARETVMPPDTDASPMFTTIEEPMDWKLDASPAESVKPAKVRDEQPPVSYLEGASANGMTVENVAFGDISVGVETESVEFSVGHPLLRLLRNILICVAAALLVSLLVTKFVAHHTSVDGSSMSSTLTDGDQLIVQQLSYYFHEPERFDVVVFPITSEDNYIKRIIGLPGETVQIIDGQVYINGSLLTDDHYGMERIEDPGNAADTIYLQKDEYFVLGDNRNASVDSRFNEVGLVKRKDIKGKAWLRFYPFSSFGFVK